MTNTIQAFKEKYAFFEKINMLYNRTSGEILVTKGWGFPLLYYFLESSFKNYKNTVHVHGDCVFWTLGKDSIAILPLQTSGFWRQCSTSEALEIEDVKTEGLMQVVFILILLFNMTSLFTCRSHTDTHTNNTHSSLVVLSICSLSWLFLLYSLAHSLQHRTHSIVLNHCRCICWVHSALCLTLPPHCHFGCKKWSFHYSMDKPW